MNVDDMMNVECNGQSELSNHKPIAEFASNGSDGEPIFAYLLHVIYFQFE